MHVTLNFNFTIISIIHAKEEKFTKMVECHFTSTQK